MTSRKDIRSPFLGWKGGVREGKGRGKRKRTVYIGGANSFHIFLAQAVSEMHEIFALTVRFCALILEII